MKMNDLMKQAQQMQKRMLEIREELANRTVEATVGGGMVTAVVNGQQEIVSLRITPEVVDPEDTEMLEDLVVAAINEALQQSQEMMSAEMSKLTGGIKIPGTPIARTARKEDMSVSVLSHCGKLAQKIYARIPETAGEAHHGGSKSCQRLVKKQHNA